MLFSLLLLLLLLRLLLLLTFMLAPCLTAVSGVFCFCFLVVCVCVLLSTRGQLQVCGFSTTAAATAAAPHKW